MSGPVQEKWVMRKPYWFNSAVIFEAFYGCHDVLILGMEATTRHDHSCTLGRLASIQTNTRDYDVIENVVKKLTDK